MTRDRGFSLVELMVVVAIIGLLAAVALPRLRTFQAKAKQSEAKSNLAHIYTLEQAYFGENDEFAAMKPQGRDFGCSPNELGFILRPCDKKKIRYNYVVVVKDRGEKFTATAETGKRNAVMTGCNIKDQWTIDQDRVLKSVSDSVKLCN